MTRTRLLMTAVLAAATGTVGIASLAGAASAESSRAAESFDGAVERNDSVVAQTSPSAVPANGGGSTSGSGHGFASVRSTRPGCTGRFFRGFGGSHGGG